MMRLLQNGAVVEIWLKSPIDTFTWEHNLRTLEELLERYKKTLSARWLDNHNNNIIAMVTIITIQHHHHSQIIKIACRNVAYTGTNISLLLVAIVANCSAVKV